MRILVINGPNLNMLGIREPEIYGERTYKDLCEYICSCADSLGVSAEIFQSNHEGVIIDTIQGAYGNYDGIIINPAAYTHYSIAIYDALLSVRIPTVEVHLTDTESREDFRRVSVIRGACETFFAGDGFLSYRKALEYFSRKFIKER